MKVRLVECDVSSLTLSPFNSRKTRPEADVSRLAERMKRDGFEATRALWGHQVAKAVAIFAGGTRLEAARLAGLKTVPVRVHDATDDELARLEALDNENDEYHVEVPKPDVWAEYHRLHEAGWTQQRIAEAKGCGVPMVCRRIGWHELLPTRARKAVCDGTFDEGHLEPISTVTCDVASLAPWLTTEQAQTELVDEVLGKHRGSTAGVKPTVAVVRDAAKRWKALISAAEEALGAFKEDLRGDFVAALAKHEVRSLAALETVKAKLLKKQAAVAAAAAADANAASSEAERKQREAEEQAAFVALCELGDARALISHAPEGFHLLLTDPPYGMGYESGRRVATAKRGKIEGDELSEAIALLRSVLHGAYPRMAADATALVFTGWRNEPLFREAIEAEGFTIRGSIVWVKGNHGSGDLTGSFAPRHERIIHAVKGNPKLVTRHDDVFMVDGKQNARHPTEKPRELLALLVAATTEEGQLVVDPFAGSGSTFEAAHALNRRFWGCEIDEKWHQRISDSLLATIRAEQKEAA